MSGLDPGQDVQVMRSLRSLAEAGRVVVVVTNSVLALDECDRILVLARGGWVAFFGPPADVLPSSVWTTTLRRSPPLRIRPVSAGTPSCLPARLTGRDGIG